MSVSRNGFLAQYGRMLRRVWYLVVIAPAAAGILSATWLQLSWSGVAINVGVWLAIKLLAIALVVPFVRRSSENV